MKRIGVFLFIFGAVAAAYFAGMMRASDIIKAPPAEWTHGSETAQAWQELLVSQEAAAARIIDATQDNSQDRLEGMDMLSDLLSVSLEMKVDKGDPMCPEFTDWMGDYRKIFGDVGDAVYHTAEIDPRREYVIFGNMGEADYIGFQLYGINPINGWNRAAANINAHEMTIAKNRDFRLTLSSTTQAQNSNTLFMSDDVHMIMVRQYFFDRRNSLPAKFSIKIVDSDQAKPIKTISDTVNHAKKIRNAAQLFNGVVDGTFAMHDMLSNDPNRSDPPRRYNPDFAGIFYPTVDNEYLGTWFNISPDEALIIEGQAPIFKDSVSGYWSISLQNRWMQSLDYSDKQTSMNSRDLIIKDDGTYRMVVAHSNYFQSGEPAKPIQALMGENGNWLETDGHKEGLLAIRYQLAQSFENPDIRLVKIGDGIK